MKSKTFQSSCRTDVARGYKREREIVQETERGRARDNIDHIKKQDLEKRGVVNRSESNK